MKRLFATKIRLNTPRSSTRLVGSSPFNCFSVLRTRSSKYKLIRRKPPSTYTSHGEDASSVAAGAAAASAAGAGAAFFSPSTVYARMLLMSSSVRAGKACITEPPYSSKIALASLSPEARNSALLRIHLRSHSSERRWVTSPRAGPTSFLSSLWQLAQLALKSFLPASALTSPEADMLKTLIDRIVRNERRISEAIGEKRMRILYGNLWPFKAGQKYDRTRSGIIIPDIRIFNLNPF